MPEQKVNISSFSSAIMLFCDFANFLSDHANNS